MVTDIVTNKTALIGYSVCSHVTNVSSITLRRNLYLGLCPRLIKSLKQE